MGSCAEPVTGERAIALGIDIGTSGVRVAALDGEGGSLGLWSARFASATDGRDPTAWWSTLEAVLDLALAALSPERVRALAVDGTSGTLLAIDAAGTPIGAPLMYDEAVGDGVLLERIAERLPIDSAAGGATSGLAKAIVLSRRSPAHVLHQADWILGRLGARFGTGDANNALKTGYDARAGRWPAWPEAVGMDLSLLPSVVAPGTPLGTLAPPIAARFSLPADVRLVAGTTDGCASFLATGASRAGEAVTALGSTTVIKLLSNEPLSDPGIGLYSHRIDDVWLAGGASNSGGRVLLQHFDRQSLETLSARIDPERASGLDYYPLPEPGERFPHADPARLPRLEPRPADDALFLHGLLEGMARIEALGYAKLAALGAPPLVSVRTVGGGASNAVWGRIRERQLGVPLVAAESTEAALGSARLALRGLRRVG